VSDVVAGLHPRRCRIHSRLEHVWGGVFKCVYCGCYVQIVMHVEYTPDELANMADALLGVECGKTIESATPTEEEGGVVCQKSMWE